MPMHRGFAGSRWSRLLRHRGLLAALLAVLLVPVAASLGRYPIRDALDHLAHGPFDAVAQRTGGLFSPAALVFHAQRQTGGRVIQLELPARNDRAVRRLVTMPYGETVVAYMDPYTADLRGTVRYAGLVATLDKLLGTASSANGSAEDLCSAELPGPPAPGSAAITLDDAVDGFERAGLSPPYAIVLPQGPAGVYRALARPGLVWPPRIIDLDARDGRRLDKAA